MKVLHVFKDYFPPSRGGIELLIHDLVHEMAGFEFEVLTSSRSRHAVEDHDDGVRVIRSPEYARPTSTPVTPAWVRELRRTDADLIHFHMPNPFGELAFLAARARVRMVASYHADIVGRRGVLPFYLPFQRSVLGRARRIIVGSEPMLRARQLHGHKDKAVVVPYGIVSEQWRRRPPEADALRARYRPPIVGFLGRLAYYKGIEVLIEAIRAVDATLLIAGSGPRRRALEELARKVGVIDRTVFLGEIDDRSKAAFYHAIDVFALPSTMRAEAFGIAMLEAMACATPAVSTELGTGTSWVNVHGQTGNVVPPGDPRALARALQELLHEPELMLKRGRAAAERVATRFTRRDMLEGITEVYREALR